MTAPALTYTARLTPRLSHPQGRSIGRSWFITHPLGGPAAGTFTEVVMPACAPDGTPLTTAVLDEVARRVAAELYGDRWAGVYGPADADRAVWGHRLVSREHVVVTSIEVFS